MRTVSEAFQARLDRTLTTLCRCWIVTRTDGVRLGFTDHDRSVPLDGIECEPESGFSASSADQEMGLSVDTTRVDGILNTERLTTEDIERGLYDGATVESWIVDWDSPIHAVRMTTNTVARIECEGDAFRADLDSLTAAYSTAQGRFFRRGCDATVGDARCGVDLSPPAYTGVASVIAIEGSNRLLVSGLSQYAIGWFSSGTLRFQEGGVERTRHIFDHLRMSDGDVLIVDDTARALPSTGATVVVVAGCDRSFSTCKAKFANAMNFRGFPHMPGNDAAYTYVSSAGHFDGQPVIP